MIWRPNSEGPPLMPANLHLAAASGACAAPPLGGRVEQKFFILPQRVSLAFALLRRTCREDPEYPAGQVNSLYFDTPDLDQHQRSDSGEYVKDKVRIRWYGSGPDPHRTAIGNGPDPHPRAVGESPGGQEDPVQVWLELKSRRGLFSAKQRVCQYVPAAALAHRALARGIVSPSALLLTMADFGFFAPTRLCPVVAISYWRDRFIEPLTGFRVSLDSHIRSSMVMAGIGSGERALELPGAIVEIKGPDLAVPRPLRKIADIGSSWTRYSKYSSSLDGHAADRGGESRLWPAGIQNCKTE